MWQNGGRLVGQAERFGTHVMLRVLIRIVLRLLLLLLLNIVEDFEGSITIINGARLDIILKCLLVSLLFLNGLKNSFYSLLVNSLVLLGRFFGRILLILNDDLIFNLLRGAILVVVFTLNGCALKLAALTFVCKWAAAFL